MSKPVELSIVKADVAEVEADLLLLKYARRFYGGDESVMMRLARLGLAKETDVNPDEDDSVTIDTAGAMSARRVVFLGTPSLRNFRYKEMRGFACRAIELIDEQDWNVRALATTVHGVGYGLDIEESLHAMLVGFQQAVARGLAPKLERIVFAERNARRFELLRSALTEMPKLTRPALSDSREPEVNLSVEQQESTGLTGSVPLGHTSQVRVDGEKKKLVFVAMPFAQEFDDVYQFGIYNVVRRCGFVCERIDESFYAGNIVDRITDGIQRAEFVIADLSAERPNVYLEVGYAWGLQRPVLLVAREGERLHFDLSHHKCIFYPTIGKLADQLESTIRGLFVSDESAS